MVMGWKVTLHRVVAHSVGTTAWATEACCAKRCAGSAATSVVPGPQRWFDRAYRRAGGCALSSPAQRPANTDATIPPSATIARVLLASVGGTLRCGQQGVGHRGVEQVPVQGLQPPPLASASGPAWPGLLICPRSCLARSAQRRSQLRRVHARRGAPLASALDRQRGRCSGSMAGDRVRGLFEAALAPGVVLPAAVTEA